jgi:hypothetical protein
VVVEHALALDRRVEVVGIACFDGMSARTHPSNGAFNCRTVEFFAVAVTSSGEIPGARCQPGSRRKWVSVRTNDLQNKPARW